MATPAPTSLLLFAAASIGALLGVFGGSMLSGVRTPAPPVATTDLAPLLDELRALRQDLVRAGTTSTRATPVPTVERREAATAAGEPPRLEHTVAELVRAVEALTVRADALGAQRAAAHGVLGLVASRSARDVPALLAIQEGRGSDDDATQAAWMFVPVTELMRRLGPPTRIGGGKVGQLWEYEFRAEGNDHWLGFTVADGVVLRVD